MAKQYSDYTTEDIYNLPDGQRAELIAGNMYMMAPPSRIHQKIVSILHAEIYKYIEVNNSSCEVYPAHFCRLFERGQQKLCGTGYFCHM
ncbi:Uma2 family endonuclease [Eubacterium sp. An11]|uniref:Uma2 family endonuclease n=1 Tax=Eubacterium sp. An11 TaxID=1965542 RepID=UPI0026892613